MIRRMLLLGILVPSLSAQPSRERALDWAEGELDSAQWAVYRQSNYLDRAQGQIDAQVREGERQRAAAAQQAARNTDLAQQVNFRRALLERAQRLRAAGAQDLAAARATMLEESARVQAEARECDRLQRSLQEWKERIAARHAEILESVARRSELTRTSMGTVEAWIEANHEREKHLTEDMLDLRERERAVEIREGVVADGNATLTEGEASLDAAEKSQAERRGFLEQSRASLEKREAMLDEYKKLLLARKAQLEARRRALPD